MKKQSKNDRMDEKISMKNGKESMKKQSFTDRRNESIGERKMMKAMPAKMGSKKK
jgi:hypothetical protein